MTQTHDTLITTLKANVCSVRFTKRDGTSRTMRCTLVESHLPALAANPAVKKDGTARKRPTDSIAVWDLDNEGWRAFRVDSVQDITTNV